MQLMLLFIQLFVLHLLQQKNRNYENRTEQPRKSTTEKA